MNGDELVAAADGITGASLTHDPQYSDDDYFAVYEGSVEPTPESVRILTVTVASNGDEALRDTFTACVREWNNVSTHPNVLRVHDWGTDPVPWVATANPDGNTLSDVQDGFTPGAVCSITSATAEALRNAGLYNTRHGNLSPGSIFVPAGEPSCLVGDWGLERLVHEFVDGEFVTPYTAPEQIADADLVDERTDVYALGAVTYEALTGQQPESLEAIGGHQATASGTIQPPSTVDDTIPTALDQPILRALSEEPAERQQSVYEFKKELDAVAPESGPGGIPGTVSDSASESTVGSTDSSAAAAETAETPDIADQEANTAVEDATETTDDSGSQGTDGTGSAPNSETQTVESGASVEDIESQVGAMETQHARRLVWLKFALLPLFVLSALPVAALIGLIYIQMVGKAQEMAIYMTVYVATPLIGFLTLFLASTVIPGQTIDAEHVQRPDTSSTVLDLFRGDRIARIRTRWFGEDGRVSHLVQGLLVANELRDDSETTNRYVERALVTSVLSAVAFTMVGWLAGWFVFAIFLGGDVSLLGVNVNRVPDLFLALKIPLLILLSGLLFGTLGMFVGFGGYLFKLSTDASSTDHRVGTGNWTARTKLVGGGDWNWRQAIRRPHHYSRDHPDATVYVFGTGAILCLVFAILWGSAPLSLEGMISNPVAGTFFWFYVPVLLTVVPLVLIGGWNRRFRHRVSEFIHETLSTAIADCPDDATVEEVLETCCEQSTATARTEFQHLRDRIDDGIDPGAAFAALAGRYRTTPLRLLAVTLRETSDPVDGISAGIDRAGRGQEFESAWLRQRPILVGIPLVIFVFLVTALALFNTEYLGVMAGMVDRASDTSIGGSAASGTGQFGSNVDTGYLSMLMFHLLTIQAVFLGLYAGYTGTRTFSRGYKYVVVTLLIALATWVVVG